MSTLRASLVLGLLVLNACAAGTATSASRLSGGGGGGGGGMGLGPMADSPRNVDREPIDHTNAERSATAPREPTFMQQDVLTCRVCSER